MPKIRTVTLVAEKAKRGAGNTNDQVFVHWLEDHVHFGEEFDHTFCSGLVSLVHHSVSPFSSSKSNLSVVRW